MLILTRVALILRAATKWCQREHTVVNAPPNVKKCIIYVYNGTRIDLYKADYQLLPPRPRKSFRHLNKLQGIE